MRDMLVRAGLLLGFGLLQATAWCQEAADTQNVAPPDHFAIEHQRIDELRAQQTKVFDEQLQACADKFAVNDCESKIKVQRRQVMADLKRQEVKINEEQRKEKAAEKLHSDADKAADNAKRDADTQAQAGQGKTETDRQKELDDKVLNHQQQAHAPVAKAPKTPSGPDAQTAEKKRQAYADKLKDLEKRRQQRDKDVREHGANGPPLPPMPK